MKIITETILNILKELRFIELKKISKSVYKASLTLGKIKIPFIIEFIDKETITKENLKLFFSDHVLPTFPNPIKGMIVTSHAFKSDLKELAQKLGLLLIEVSDLFMGIIPFETHLTGIVKQEKKELSYNIPSLLKEGVGVEVHYFFNKLKDPNSPIMILEGNIGMGKALLISYLRYLLADHFFKEQEGGIIPITLDARLYSSYSRFEDYLIQEGFIKKGIPLQSYKPLSLLQNLHKVVYFIENIESLETLSYTMMVSFLENLSQIKKEGALILITANKGTFEIFHKEKRYFKHFYRTFFLTNSVDYYELEGFSFSLIKQKMADLKRQKIIENHSFLKDVAKIPLFLEFFNNMTLENLTNILDYRSLFYEINSLWETKSLTSMGKEELLQIMSMTFIEKGNFTANDIPSYLENFVNIEYKNKDDLHILFVQELTDCPFIERNTIEKESYYYFSHSFFLYYYATQKLQEEIKHHNYEHLSFFIYPWFFPFLSTALSQRDILTINENLLLQAENSFKRSNYFTLFYRIKSYSKEVDARLIQGKDLSGMNISYATLNEFDFKDISFENSNISDSDTRFSTFYNVNFNKTLMNQTNYDSCLFQACLFKGTSLKKSSGKNSQFKEQIFKNVDFFESFLVKINVTNCILEDSNLAGSILVESVWQKTDFSACDLSNTDYTKSHFSQVKIMNCETVSFNGSFMQIDSSQLFHLNFFMSYFDSTRFNDTSFEDIDFSTTRLFQASFINCRLSKVNFNLSDLRNTMFKGSKLVDVDFTDADLRGSSILRDAAEICEKTRKSLEKALF